jgi:hypothetical protein
MRLKKTFTTLIFIAISVCSLAGVLVVTGIYQGKDVYIQNPFVSDAVGFCVYEVTVNGKVTTDEVNSSAFAIDLNQLELQVGDELEIKIMHKDNCVPKVLNPEVLKPLSSFEVTQIKIDSEGMMVWNTKNEAGKLPYIVEQFRWNKWVKIGEIDGLGTKGEHEYKFKVAPHYGENEVRIKQIDYTTKPRYSEVQKFTKSSVSKVKFDYKKATNLLTFSASTMYEIFDQYGNLKKKGFDIKIDVTDLEKGIYYLNYDNSFGETFKK